MFLKSFAIFSIFCNISKYFAIFRNISVLSFIIYFGLLIFFAYYFELFRNIFRKFAKKFISPFSAQIRIFAEYSVAANFFANFRLFFLLIYEVKTNKVSRSSTVSICQFIMK